MTARFCLAAALLLVPVAAAPAADPTVEELRAAPDKYVGQTVSLNKVKVYGGVLRDRNGTASVHLRSAAGRVGFTVQGGTRFTLAPAVADQVVKAIGNGFKLNATPVLVTGTVKREGNGYVCEITRMSVYNANGTVVMRTFGD